MIQLAVLASTDSALMATANGTIITHATLHRLAGFGADERTAAAAAETLEPFASLREALRAAATQQVVTRRAALQTGLMRRSPCISHERSFR